MQFLPALYLGKIFAVLLSAGGVVSAATASPTADLPAAQLAQAQAWIAREFQPSTLTSEQQLAEMTWFIRAAAPYRGLRIRVVSENIGTHVYESNVLARAFAQITGIQVVHEITGEDDVVKKLQAQMQTGLPIYDAYVNDSDFIGAHFRMGKTLVLSDYMLAEGRAVTSPTLDLADFMGLRFTSGPDGKLYQLPDQQFANLYWYRQDWFSRPELQRAFKQRYVQSAAMTKAAPRLGGLVEFYRSHARDVWTPTGTNVPDYASLAPLWWQELGPLVDDRQTVESSLHNLASKMDLELARIAERGEMQHCEPRLGEPREAAYWLSQPGAPMPKTDEHPPGQTLNYPEAIQKWQ